MTHLRSVEFAHRAKGGTRGQRGASLIEVLVSILIISFGVLAMAALLANASRFNKTTEFRSVATLLVADLADRMRANTVGAMGDPAATPPVSPAYDTTPSGYSAAVPTAAPAAPTACVAATACTAAELAAIDMSQWRTALYYSLPGAVPFVRLDRGNKAVDVWIAWVDPKAGDLPAINNCPVASFAGAADPPPRCMYFRVGL
jgi:type IV pilus assembly protein PilV